MASALVEALPLLFKAKVIFLHNVVGATLSTTVTVRETGVSVRPQASVAVQVSV